MATIKELRRDLREAASSLGPAEARYLVDTYYQLQKDRVREAARVRQANGEPMLALATLRDELEALEKSIVPALERYADTRPVGRWALSICGVGPVLAAGLLAHIDLGKTPTYGGLWRFAGQDPSAVWAKGTKRPWNAELKRLCFLLGESFIKQRGRESDVYGTQYARRKEALWWQNVQGRFAEAARERAGRVGKGTDAYKWYAGCVSAGMGDRVRLALLAGQAPPRLECGEAGSGLPMLPPAHVHARARRFAVKLFLSHYHHAGRVLERVGAVPEPYPFAHQEGHTGYIGPPHLDADWIVGLRRGTAFE